MSHSLALCCDARHAQVHRDGRTIPTLLTSKISMSFNPSENAYCTRIEMVSARVRSCAVAFAHVPGCWAADLCTDFGGHLLN
jgi:hypothetical protein